MAFAFAKSVMRKVVVMESALVAIPLLQVLASRAVVSKDDEGQVASCYTFSALKLGHQGGT